MKIHIRRWADLSTEERQRILSRSENNIQSVESATQQIIQSVEKNGDVSVRNFTREFDKANIDSLPLRVTEEECQKAESTLTPAVKEALAAAIENVERFHSTQIPQGMQFVETVKGLYTGERVTSIPSVGLYVPRGKGSFPSMLYMMAVPAKIAGVPRICVTTPPEPDGSVDPACLYAASLCGVHEVYRIGGAQAIAALVLGTESIRPVVKIMGPGSPYVSAAKRLLNTRIDTGIPAGPSESMILADESADPWNVSLDLLIEAEHGDDSAALLITTSTTLAEAVAKETEKLIQELPKTRRGFVESVFAGYGGIFLADSPEEALQIVNDFAPEHLQIQTRDPFATLPGIINAGEILLGPNTPFSLANYAAGPNAVLPTGGRALTWSPVSVRDFIKYSSVVYATEEAFESMKETVTTLSEYEGFPGHAKAFTHRRRE